jgi:hypothetical protein
MALYLQMHKGLGHKFLKRGPLGWCHEVFRRVLDGEEPWMGTLELSTPRLRTTATSRTDPSGPVARGQGRGPPPLSLCLYVLMGAPVARGRGRRSGDSFQRGGAHTWWPTLLPCRGLWWQRRGPWRRRHGWERMREEEKLGVGGGGRGAPLR